jgi:DNA-binding beta-propeller fold protein YncE
MAYITNEKGNSISVIDLDKLEVVKTRILPSGLIAMPSGSTPTGISATTTQSMLSTPRRWR